MKATVVSLFVALQLIAISLFLGGSTAAQSAARRTPPMKSRVYEKPGVMKDTFYEDNSFVVKVRTSYNLSCSVTCNAVLMEENLVLSDVTCIKYNNMANIDAKYVQVITGGENVNESYYDVEQIYINKADPKDPGTELAILKLARPIKADTECRTLIRPEKNHSIEADSAVRVIGYTHWYELKENRTRVSKRQAASKYICTTPAEHGETPGGQLLKGAPLLHMIDCKHYQLIGILTSTTDVQHPGSTRKQQDCFVQVSSQMKWFDQVKSLSSLAAKRNDDSIQPSVVVVTVDENDKDNKSASLAPPQETPTSNP